MQCPYSALPNLPPTVYFAFQNLNSLSTATKYCTGSEMRPYISALHVRKRALHFRQRAQYVCQPAVRTESSSNCVYSNSSICVYSSTPSDMIYITMWCFLARETYGVALVSSIDKIICLFRKRDL